MADGDVALHAILARAGDLAIPVVVLGEYRYGIAQSRSRVRYEHWLRKDIIANCRILIIDEETAAEYADIRSELRQKGRPIPANDVWIAALARQHAMEVLSRDEHFDFVPNVRRIGW
jgi:predicted nucleic acid-binding protein